MERWIWRSFRNDALGATIGASALKPGANNDGVPVGVIDLDYQEIIKRLENITRDSVATLIIIDHSVLSYHGKESFFAKDLH